MSGKIFYKYIFHDSEAAAPLVDEQPEERKPDTVLCDMAYGTGQNREEMIKRQVKLICPVPTNLGRNGCFSKSAFTIDLDSHTLYLMTGKKNGRPGAHAA